VGTAAFFGAGTPDRLLTLVNAADAALVKALDEAVPKACARTVDCGEAAMPRKGPEPCRPLSRRWTGQGGDAGTSPSFLRSVRPDRQPPEHMSARGTAVPRARALVQTCDKSVVVSAAAGPYHRWPLMPPRTHWRHHFRSMGSTHLYKRQLAASAVAIVAVGALAPRPPRRNHRGHLAHIRQVAVRSAFHPHRSLPPVRRSPRRLSSATRSDAHARSLALRPRRAERRGVRAGQHRFR